MNTQEQIIFNTANRLLAGTKTAAICIELADGKSAYLGDDAGVMHMLQNKDQSGAAVRGEAVALTDVDRLRMPKRDAFIEWAKDRAFDVTESKDAWGNREFVHPHIESIWFGWFHAPSAVSARAADAPSEPSEPEKLDTDQSREYLVKFMEQYFTDKTYHRYIRGERGSVNLAGDFAWQMARAIRMIERNGESRAADALDSQPTEPYPLLRAAFTTAESGVDGYFVKFRFPTLQAMQDAHRQWHGVSSQPTDGGVRK